MGVHIPKSHFEIVFSKKIHDISRIFQLFLTIELSSPRRFFWMVYDLSTIYYSDFGILGSKKFDSPYSHQVSLFTIQTLLKRGVSIMQNSANTYYRSLKKFVVCHEVWRWGSAMGLPALNRWAIGIK